MPASLPDLTDTPPGGPNVIVDATMFNAERHALNYATAGRFNILEQSATAGGGGVDDSAALYSTDAINAGNGVTYLPPTPNRYRIANSGTVAHAISLPPGALLAPDAGVTLTINGPLGTGPYQVFDLSAGGAVALGAGTCERVYPEWWGASPSASAATNVAAFTAALATGKPVHIPSVGYHVNSAIPVPAGAVVIGGTNPGQNVGANATLIGDSSSDDIFHLVADGNGNVARWLFRDLMLAGGQNQIVENGGCDCLYLDNVTFLNPAIAGYTSTNYTQDACWTRVWFIGGQYGVYVPYSTTNYFDKNSFYGVRCQKQTINGWFLEAGAESNNNTWVDLWLVQIAQHGFHADGGLGHTGEWTFLNPVTEGNGYKSGGTTYAYTTGSIAASSTSLSLASASTFANGDTVTVQGAGAGGTDLSAVVSSGGGTTTLILATAASVGVSSVQVSNAVYDDFNFTAVRGPNISGVQFVGGALGSLGGNGNLRYSINASGADNVSVLGTQLQTNNSQGSYLVFYDPNGTGYVQAPATVQGRALPYRGPSGVYADSANADHLVASGGVPTFVQGPALGTSPPSVSVPTGATTDTAGVVYFGSGTSPTTGVLMTITFSKPFKAAPRVVISPAEGNGTAGLGLYCDWYSNTPTQAVIKCATAPAASQAAATYGFQFVVIG